MSLKVIKIVIFDRPYMPTFLSCFVWFRRCSFHRTWTWAQTQKLKSFAYQQFCLRFSALKIMHLGYLGPVAKRLVTGGWFQTLQPVPFTPAKSCPRSRSRLDRLHHRVTTPTRAGLPYFRWSRLAHAQLMTWQ